MALSVCGGAALLTLTLAFAIAGTPAASRRLQAQSGAVSLGYRSCDGSECHTKSGEIDWLTSQPGGKEHRASFGRLTKALDVSLKYAKAVGLADFKDPAGMCVKCHATFVARAKTLDGVGCEGCHGAASGYREFHQQTPKDYAGAVQRGMRNLQRKPNVWVGICRDCHVLTNKPEYDKLIEEGHKDGARWNVSKKYETVQTHWKKVTYTAALIDAAAAGRAVAVPAAPPAPPPAPAVVPSAPAVTPPVTPPVTSPVTPPPVTPPVTPPATKSGTAPSPAAPTIPPAPVPSPRGAPAPAPSAPATAPPFAPPVVPAPPPVVPPPLPPPEPASPLALTLPAPVSATGLLAALQDRVEGLLASLLRRDTVPAAPLKPLPPPPSMSGPDAELLRLQYEALGLAIEALNLRVKKTPPGPPK